VPSIDLHAPRSASFDVKLASMPVESFREHPAPSRSRGTSEATFRSPENVPCLKRPWSPRVTSRNSRTILWRPSRSEERVRCHWPDLAFHRLCRFCHARLHAPKSLSTPCGSALDPRSFACVESSFGLPRTLPITRLTLPIQRSQRTDAQMHTNLRRAWYTSSCSPLDSPKPLLWTPARFEPEFLYSQTPDPSSPLEIFSRISDDRNTSRSAKKVVGSAFNSLTRQHVASRHCLSVPKNALTL
jgi:hypothetical protein